MNQLPILPMELINKILCFRPTHPTAVIIKPFIERYIAYDEDPEFIDDDDEISDPFYTIMLLIISRGWLYQKQLLDYKVVSLPFYI
jgi:hypothetical protein